jgi:hypothetical protein
MLNKDMLVQIGIELDLPSLLKLCQSSKEINNKLCQQDTVWHYKLEKDFNEYLNSDKYPKFYNIYKELGKKGYYMFLYKLSSIKKVWNLKQTLKQLYSLTDLKLIYWNIKIIPREIGVLQNLKLLDLSCNHIKSIPKEIGQLKNLETLYLGGNKIQSIPKEIGELHNLKRLHLAANDIEIIPEELGQLDGLLQLYLCSNPIKYKEQIEEWLKHELPNTEIAL